MKNPQELTPLIDELYRHLRAENNPQICLRLATAIGILDAIRREDYSLLDIIVRSEYVPKSPLPL